MIRPLTKFRGVSLTPQQTKDYVAGKTIRLDGCSGSSPTIHIRFDKSSMKLQVSSPGSLSPTQPASPRQSVAPKQSASTAPSISSPRLRNKDLPAVAVTPVNNRSKNSGKIIRNSTTSQLAAPTKNVIKSWEYQCPKAHHCDRKSRRLETSSLRLFNFKL